MPTKQKIDSFQNYNLCTELALLKIVDDILLNMNGQHVSLLVLLYLSAAFDTVDHDILLRRLDTSFGVTGDAVK